jgi:hypothetical protein
MFFYNVNLQGRAWEIHWEGKSEMKEGVQNANQCWVEYGYTKGIYQVMDLTM